MELASIFLAVSMSQGLPPLLLDSVCWQESNHRQGALNRYDGGSPSIGICQVKRKTCNEVGVKGNLFDPKVNIECAGRYLARQINRYRDVRKGVCAYNRGHSNGTGNNRYTRRVFHEWAKRLSGGQL